MHILRCPQLFTYEEKLFRNEISNELSLGQGIERPA